MVALIDIKRVLASMGMRRLRAVASLIAQYLGTLKRATTYPDSLYQLGIH